MKGFPENVELEVAATYASGGTVEIERCPTSRGVTINVHYSISELPQTGYQPRLADDRVGYFLTVVKDFSSKSDDDQFVRYINRWDLQKADSVGRAVAAEEADHVLASRRRFRSSIASRSATAFYEWNKAFEKAGFDNAIEVAPAARQRDDWDPEDIRYNTFRWITSNAGFAMGPSRVNPYTGQILDADIIFDADFLHVLEAGVRNVHARKRSPR